MSWITLGLLSALLVVAMILVALAAAWWSDAERSLPRRPLPMPKHGKRGRST